MKNDEIVFIIKDETLENDNPEISLANVKERTITFVCSHTKQLIIGAVILAIVCIGLYAVLHIFAPQSNPVHYYIDTDGCLIRIINNNPPVKLLSNEYYAIQINSSPNMKEAYITALKSNQDHNVFPIKYIFYIDKYSNVELVAKGEGLRVECINDLVLLIDENYIKHNQSGYDIVYSIQSRSLYHLNGTHKELIAENFRQIGSRIDGRMSVSYINDKYELYRVNNGEKYKLSDNVYDDQFFCAPYSDEIYFYERIPNKGLKLYVSSRGAEKKLIYENKQITGDQVSILKSGNEVFFIDNRVLYNYKDGELIKVTDKCERFIFINSDDTHVPTDGRMFIQRLDGLYFRDDRGNIEKIRGLPDQYQDIDIFTDKLNNKIYLFNYSNGKLYSGDMKSFMLTGFSCVVEDAPEVVANKLLRYNNNSAGEIYGYVLNERFYTLTRDGKGNKFIDKKVYQVYLKNGLLIFDLVKDAAIADMYFVKNGCPPRLVAEDVILDPNNISKQMCNLYFTYCKESKSEPGKYEIYATNGDRTVKMSKDYPLFAQVVPQETYRLY